jgi:UDP-glucuronate 4-epimerase
MTILVTGAAGFIGNHVALRLLEDGHRVVGFDNLSPYYDVALKRARLERLTGFADYAHVEGDLCDVPALRACFSDHGPDRVVHLAAQPGVRFSIEQPQPYIQSNLVGFANLLECCRHGTIRHLMFASTSSVYGANTAMPYSEHHACDHPVSLYAATKKANEAMAHSYAHLYGIATTGLRFFTVYGEWGRPDMAFFKFTDAIINGRPIEVHNNGRMSRDFTYVADIVDGIVALLDRPATIDSEWDAGRPDPASSGVAPYRIYNIGNSRPVDLMRYVEALEECIGRKATIEFKPMQPGDVADTWADCTDLAETIGYSPSTPVEEGLANFVAWYKSYYRVN